MLGYKIKSCGEEKSMNIKKVRRSFDAADQVEKKSFDSFSPRFVRGISRVLGGDNE